MLHAQRDWCRDHDVQHVLIVPGPDDTVTRDGPLTTYTVASPLLPGAGAYRLLYRSRRVLRILRDEMPDVIEVHCAYNLPWTALWHRRRHPAVVSGVYMTDLPVAYVEAPLRTRMGRHIARAARRITERYVRALYSRCDVVIAISPVMRDRLLEMGVSQALCVPLGVDLATFTPERRSLDVRTGMGAGADDLVIAYAGRLDAEKRPDIVFDAFDLLPADLNARLVIAGDGPMRSMMEQRAAGDHRVRVLPFVQNRAEMAALLASADIYASAMAHETFGLSVVEAQACGLPVVGVRAGAMVDRVIDGDTGFLVEPGSAAKMAQRIADTPRGDWRLMGARARRRVEAEFSWRRTFETLLQIYRSR
ncbi:MAG: glycosyltransferase [Gemmatimonadetes bacterium]|nr:glycosyltransferase [Gemmatimonadota bacterium]